MHDTGIFQPRRVVKPRRRSRSRGLSQTRRRGHRRDLSHPATLLSALVMVVVTVAVAGCGSSAEPKTSSSHAATTAPSAPPATSTTVQSAETSVVVSGSLRGVSASMHPSSHHPKVQVPWPITFTVTRYGRAAHASVSYEYLFGGQVVARRSHYMFTGHFADTFHWPATAVGYPLTFRAVIVCEGVTINLDYPVQVVA